MSGHSGLVMIAQPTSKDCSMEKAAMETASRTSKIRSSDGNSELASLSTLSDESQQDSDESSTPLESPRTSDAGSPDTCTCSESTILGEDESEYTLSEEQSDLTWMGAKESEDTLILFEASSTGKPEDVISEGDASDTYSGGTDEPFPILEYETKPSSGPSSHQIQVLSCEEGSCHSSQGIRHGVDSLHSTAIRLRPTAQCRLNHEQMGSATNSSNFPPTSAYRVMPKPSRHHLSDSSEPGILGPVLCNGLEIRKQSSKQITRQQTSDDKETKKHILSSLDTENKDCQLAPKQRIAETGAVVPKNSPESVSYSENKNSECMTVGKKDESDRKEATLATAKVVRDTNQQGGTCGKLQAKKRPRTLAAKSRKRSVTYEGESKGNSHKKAYAVSKALATLSSIRSGTGQPQVVVPVDSRNRPYPYLLPSPVPGLPDTICFKGTPEEKEAAGLRRFTKRKVFVRFKGIANTPVRLAFLKAGLRSCDSTSNARWHVLWGSRPKQETLRRLNRYQRINHLLGTWEVGRKDRLYKNIARLRRSKGPEFDIIPQFYLLPRDRTKLKHDSMRYPSRLYIRKPVASSRGRGVGLVKKPSSIPKKKICLVQRYVQNPLTINGYKVDIRLYVGVTSLDPLRVYIYKDGLVRFATEVYKRDKATLSRRCMHLTNYSVNKNQETFVRNKSAEEDDVGSKWSLTALKHHLEKSHGIQWRKIHSQFHDIVAKTMISVESKMNVHTHLKMPSASTCFEIFGFDVLLDENYKAWLIEVNTYPDLGASSPLDMKIKVALVEDMLNMVGIVPCDIKAYQRKLRIGRHRKLLDEMQADKKTLPGISRTIKEAFKIDIMGLPLEKLPESIKQSEAELQRCGDWEMVIPCQFDPLRYQHLFESQRFNNILLCRKQIESQSHMLAVLHQSVCFKVEH